MSSERDFFDALSRIEDCIRRLSKAEEDLKHARTALFEAKRAGEEEVAKGMVELRDQKTGKPIKPERKQCRAAYYDKDHPTKDGFTRNTDEDGTQCEGDEGHYPKTPHCSRNLGGWFTWMDKK